MEQSITKQPVLLIFSQINPLDSVAVKWIQSVEQVGEHYNFNIVSSSGRKWTVRRRKTDWLTEQILGFNLEVYGS